MTFPIEIGAYCHRQVWSSFKLLTDFYFSFSNVSRSIMMGNVNILSSIFTMVVNPEAISSNAKSEDCVHVWWSLLLKRFRYWLCVKAKLFISRYEQTWASTREFNVTFFLFRVFNQSLLIENFFRRRLDVDKDVVCCLSFLLLALLVICVDC